jgi:DNA polymerase III subunit alpha
MANAAQNFVHLHVHSSYSLLEGAVGIPELSKLAAKDGMAALALTDTNNLFGALEFSEKLSGAGIQPIVGIDLAVVFDDVQSPRGSGQPSQITDGSLVLLAMDEQGYENLMALSSAAFLTPAIDAGVGVNFERLEALSDGLIVLSGGICGPVDRLLASGKASEALARFERLRRVFGDRFYVEVQRFDAQFDHEEELVSWADRYGVGLVATNNVLFGQQSGHAAHDALMCIAEGRVIAEQHRRRIPQEQYFRSQAEMVARFADLPDAIANTVEIARRCSYRPLTRKPILPQFASGGDEGDELARQAIEGGFALGGAPACLRHDGRGLPEQARFRTRCDPEDAVFRLFSDRFGFHQICQKQKHTGWTRAWFGRRLACCLCLDDH